MKCTKVLPTGEGTEFVAAYVYKGRPRSRSFRIEEGNYMAFQPKEDAYVKAAHYPWTELKGCRFIVV